MRADTIPARLLEQANVRPYAPAYHVESEGHWRQADWATYVHEVRQAGKALIAMGVEPGDHVAIVAGNRPEWVIFHLAALCAGGASAGVYPACSAEEVRDMVAHVDARVVLVDRGEQAASLLAGRSARLRQVVVLGGAGTGEPTGADLDRDFDRDFDRDLQGGLDWDGFVALGAGVPDSALDARIDGLDPDALAALVYTPGTEGRPRAVMLSHRNLAWTAEALCDLFGSGPGDAALCYLPLAHIIEQMLTIYLPATAGSAVYFAPGPEAVAKNLRQVQPTVLFGLPRIWERFHAAVADNLAARPASQSIIEWVRRVGREVSEFRNQGRRPGPIVRFKHLLARYLLLARLAPALGVGRARFCASGGAPMAEELLDFFSSLDVIIHETYGQTESCAIASANRPGATRFGTAGRPLAGVDIDIAGDGEILIRGGNVFMGYYNDTEASREALPGGGWLRTGDLGRIDEDGFVTVIGRKHEILTVAGARIAPQAIEAALETSPLIQAAVLTGHGQAYVTALITLDPDATAGFLAEAGAASGAVDRSPVLRAAVQAEVDRVNGLLAKDEAIVKFTILRGGFTVERGELTPMLTLRRSAIHDIHAAAIAAMYDE